MVKFGYKLMAARTDRPDSQHGPCRADRVCFWARWHWRCPV